MYTKQITLQSGKPVTLAPADLYQLIASDYEIPNQALLDLTDLINYGSVMDVDTDANRLEANKRLIRMQYEIARLVCYDPEFALDGSKPLAPRDLTKRDLNQIFNFFQTGGSDSMPATTDPQS